MKTWHDELTKYVENGFPQLSSDDWQVAEEQFQEAERVLICYRILDQLHTDGRAQIFFKHRYDYNNDEFKNTQTVCNGFKKYGFNVSEVTEGDETNFFIQHSLHSLHSPSK